MWDRPLSTTSWWTPTEDVGKALHCQLLGLGPQDSGGPEREARNREEQASIHQKREVPDQKVTDRHVSWNNRALWPALKSNSWVLLLLGQLYCYLVPMLKQNQNHSQNNKLTSPSSYWRAGHKARLRKTSAPLKQWNTCPVPMAGLIPWIFG